jgi:LPS-assembly protein
MTKSKIPATLLAILSISTRSEYIGAQTADNWVCEPSTAGKWVCGIRQQTESIYGKPDLPFKRNVRNSAILAKGIKSGAIVDPNTKHNLDWHYRDQIAADRLATLAPYCEGTYIEPLNDSPTAGQIFDTAALAASANSSELQQDRQAKFSGDVYIANGDMRVYAAEAIVDQETEILTLSGNVVIRDNNLLMQGTAATINTTDSTGNIENAEYVLHDAHMRGEATTIERESQTIANLQQSFITHCAPDSNAWSMKASKIVLNQETGMGTATHAVIKVKDVPVMYVPYITYPIDGKRRTGLLWPSIAASDEGIDITQPIYLNIAPNWDATLSPRYIGDRGLATELEVRHLNKYSDWVVSSAHIDDKLYEDTRWIVGVDERGRFNSNWWHSIDYTSVSDNDFFNDLGTESLTVRRTVNLRKEAKFGYQSANWAFTTTATEYQTLDDSITEQYKLLPEMELQYRQGYEDFALSPLLYTQLTQFDIEDTTKAKGTRLYAEPGVTFPMRWTGGFLTPTAKVRSVTYKLDDEHRLPTANEDSVGATVPMFSLDGGLYFDRDSNWFGSEYTHSLEPRLYYLYSEFEDQSDQPLFDTGQRTFDYNQLFRESRFTGVDRIDDADQISMGITTRFTNKATGVETFNASLGQIRYFKDRETTTNGSTLIEDSSEVAGELMWQPIDGLKNRISILYDHREHFVKQGSYKMTYRGESNVIFNLGASYRNGSKSVDAITGEETDTTTRQSNVSTIFPISNHWSAIARFNYDHTNERELEQVAGLTYESCCWKTSILYQEGIDSNNEIDRGFYIEFQLKGLGGSGNKINSILSDSIEGYNERELYEH